MRTIVFALQVAALIALLPVCIVLEIQHGTKAVPAQEVKASVAGIVASASFESKNAITAYPFTVLTLKKVNVATKKKAGSTCCSCKKCACGSNCKCTDL